ncbi:hypothetical protein JI739_01835 [Ramlibacter sp. AW1]|uniref:Uncharacterized protein n=1 Tax=Ramlibacter aurantiacus TaxID=2801330 RepID=A0A937D392_9BURK|nr:hypothetical protein [Ramlibacter aurantiacus]MBL0419077.1 hypothetical protein [Ramlibacter aurantiacus]
MVFNASIALNWILFLALFPISFFWLRRAWRIVVRRDFSEVALRRGESPPDPERFAPYDAVLNFVAGVLLVVVIALVLTGSADFSTWTSMAGSTLWCKFLLGFALARHAHARPRASAGPAK